MNFNGGAHNATPDSKPAPGGLGPVVPVSAFIIFSIVAGVALVVHLRSRGAQPPQTLDDSAPEPVAAASALPTPPVFVTPLTMPNEATAATPVTSAPTPPILDSGAYDRARTLVMDGRDSDARALLEPRVRAGRGSPDEALLLKTLCKRQRDKACVADIKSKYPAQ